MTAHTDLIARLRRGWTTDCLLAADALESLEQQVATMKAVAHLEKVRAENAEQQVAALRVDAERYRWLRERHWVEGETRFRLNLMQATSDHEADMLELDSAIDAAMGEK